MVTRADTVADHAHGRNGGEAGHTVRTPGLDCVDLRRRDDLDRLVPGGSDESAPAARADVAVPQVRRGHELGPGGQRIVVVARLGRPEHLQQDAAHVGVADPGRRIGVPRERGAPRAAARLVFGAIRTDGRVVGLLCLPGDDVVLDVDLPGARAGAVNAVCRPHDLVVRPAIPIEGVGVAPARLREGAQVVGHLARPKVPAGAKECLGERVVQARGGPVTHCVATVGRSRRLVSIASARTRTAATASRSRPSA